MNNQKKIIVILLIVVAAVVGYYLYSKQAGGQSGRGFHWEQGQVYEYALDYSTDHRTSVFTGVKNIKQEQMTFDAKVHLVATLVLRSYGYNEGSEQYRLGISLKNFKQHEFLFTDQNLLPDQETVDAAFDGQEAIIVMSQNGEVHNIYIKPGSPEMFSNTVQTLMGEIQIILGGEEENTWTVTEGNHHGEASCDYSLKSSGGDGLDVEKTRDDYAKFHLTDEVDAKIKQKVDATYVAQIADEGHLKKLEGAETIEVTDITIGPIMSVDTKISLELVETGEFKSELDLAAFIKKARRRQLGTISISDDAKTRSFSKRVGNMTPAKMKSDLLTYGNAGKMPKHAKWVWQVTGLLKLHPEHCNLLVSVFEDEKLNYVGKKVLLDVLVGTGHKEAQTVLLRLLNSPLAKEDEEYSAYLQRISLLEKPSTEIAKFSLDRLEATREGEEKDTNVHYGASFVLGAVTGKLKKAGETELADEYNKVLVDQLLNAETPMDKRVYLRSLGNASLKENVPVAAKFAEDPSNEVRRAVLNAIKRTQTPEAEEVVLNMVGDRVGIVQNDALRVLGDYEVSVEHMENVQEAVTTGKINSLSQGALTSLLVKQHRRGGQIGSVAEASLRKLLDQRISADTRSRISNALSK